MLSISYLGLCIHIDYAFIMDLLYIYSIYSSEIYCQISLQYFYNHAISEPLTLLYLSACVPSAFLTLNSFSIFWLFLLLRVITSTEYSNTTEIKA